MKGSIYCQCLESIGTHYPSNSASHHCPDGRYLLSSLDWSSESTEECFPLKPAGTHLRKGPFWTSVLPGGAIQNLIQAPGTPSWADEANLSLKLQVEGMCTCWVKWEVELASMRDLVPFPSPPFLDVISKILVWIKRDGLNICSMDK